MVENAVKVIYKDRKAFPEFRVVFQVFIINFKTVQPVCPDQLHNVRDMCAACCLRQKCLHQEILRFLNNAPVVHLNVVYQRQTDGQFSLPVIFHDQLRFCRDKPFSALLIIGLETHRFRKTCCMLCAFFQATLRIPVYHPCSISVCRRMPLRHALHADEKQTTGNQRPQDTSHGLLPLAKRSCSIRKKTLLLMP